MNTLRNPVILTGLWEEMPEGAHGTGYDLPCWSP